MKIYPAKKTGFFLYVMLGLFLLVGGILLLDSEGILSNPLLLLLTLSPLFLFLWIYFDTSYSTV